MGTRLPALGSRGEGWVVAQLVLFAIIAVAGLRDLVGHGSASPWGTAVSLTGLTTILVGGVVAGRAARDLRASLSPFPRPVAGAQFTESGAYRHIRHPIYSGLVLAALGWGARIASADAHAGLIQTPLLRVGWARITYLRRKRTIQSLRDAMNGGWSLSADRPSDRPCVAGSLT